VGHVRRQRRRQHAPQALTLPLARLAALCAVLAVAISGCGGGSSPAPTTRTPPDFAAFLRLPVATPSTCPSSVNGTTIGRSSPWVGHVDISVYVAVSATPQQVTALGTSLANEPEVAHVYRETKSQAYAEFQRLYTCSAGVPPSAVPASYRLVLNDVDRSARDALVRRIYAIAGVESVSCDPVSPCVNVRPAG
jgi:hypothetical protein